MRNPIELNIKMKLPYPTAGVSFEIECDSSIQGDNFKVTALSHKDSTPLKITNGISLQLVDWAKGYARWLNRANVSADFDENGVKGKLRDGLTTDELLDSLNLACDMIDQRFSHYEETIITA
jgi:hypothetical protein